MLKAVPFANAAAIVCAILYVICAAWAIVSMTSFLAFFGTWFHGFDLSQLPLTQLNLASVIFGLVTATIIAWIVSYVFVLLYNQFAK